MGTFWNFAELKKHGEKLIRFKQETLIQGTKGRISDKHFRIVEDGACVAFSMAWLRQELAGPAKFQSSPFARTQSPAEALDLALSLIPVQIVYDKASTVDKGEDRVARAFGLKPDREREIKTQTLPEILDKVAAAIKEGEGWYVSFNHDVDEAHVIAMVRRQGLRFFDPTAGAWRINDDANAGFFSAYQLILTDKLKWTPNTKDPDEAWAFPVFPL